MIDPLRTATLDIEIREGGSRAESPPLLPFGLRLGNVEVDRLRVLRAEQTYSLRRVHFDHASIGGPLPATVSAEGRFELEHERFPLSATLTLGGTLERLETHLGLRQGDITADIRAVLAPFRPQHLVTLEARASPIDLARFSDELPHAALALVLNAKGNERGLEGTAALTNSAPGPIDQGKLPVASVTARATSKDLENASLQELRIVLADGGMLEGLGELSPEGFTGTLKASRLNLRALRSTLRETHLSGPLEVSLARGVQTVRGTLSQEGMTVSAEAVRRGDTVEVKSLRAAAQGGELSGTGTLRLTDPLAFSAKLTLARFDPAAFGDYPDGSISGLVTADGHLGRGEHEVPRVDLGWSLSNSTLLDEPLETHGSARVAGRRVLQADAEARLGTSHASAHGGFGTAGDKLAWTLDVPSLEDFVDSVAGRVRASGTLGGTWAEPAAVIAAEFQELELPHGYKIAGATASISGTLARHEGRLTVRTEAAEMQARLRGGLTAPRSWAGEIVSLEGAGKVGFTMRGATPLRVSGERFELGRLEAAVGDGQLLVREFAWSKERLASSGEFARLPAQWLVAAAGLTDKLRSTLLLDGQWTISAAPNLDGSLRLRRAAGDLVLLDDRPIELGLESIALDARFTNAGVGASLELVSRFATGAIRGQLGRDPAAGAIGLGPNSALLLSGQIELARARLLTQPVLGDARFDGRLSGELEGSGTLGAPVISGTLRGDGISFEYPLYGIYLKNGELRAKIDGDTLRLERFTIQAGDGTFSANGTLPLRLTGGAAKLAWQAKSLSVLDRPDLRLVVSGEGEAGFDGKRLLLSGELRADRGKLELERERVPKLGEDVVVAGQTRPSLKDKNALPVHLNIDLDLGSNLEVHVQGLEGKLTGRVTLSTTKDGELRAYGKLTTVNATFFAYGQRLQVDPGILIFDGPIDNPALQVTAWRRNQAVEAGVQVSGTVRAPRVEIVSQPAVSEGERLSWLVLGRAPTDATKADLGMLQAAAGALLARGDSMPLDRRIARSFGLDEVSFRGSGEVQDRVLALGKRLSDKLYVSYEQGLGTVASNLVKLDYALSRRWSLRAETGTSSGWGLFYRFSWD
ncbi:MAG TPA: translocation/assembly module TamB domain-containing protein [Burkholderiales bacterium]